MGVRVVEIRCKEFDTLSRLKFGRKHFGDFVIA